MSFEYHWEWWERMTTPPEPLPTPEPTPWEIQKSANRLARQIARVESGQFIPKLSFRLNGRAVREYQEAKTLLAETAQAVKGG